MTVSLEQAQLSLGELIDRTFQGERVIITQDQKPVAELCRIYSASPSPMFGSCKGMLAVIAEDGDHLTDFNEHMK